MGVSRARLQEVRAEWTLIRRVSCLTCGAAVGDMCRKGILPFPASHGPRRNMAFVTVPELVALALRATRVSVVRARPPPPPSPSPFSSSSPPRPAAVAKRFGPATPTAAAPAPVVAPASPVKQIPRPAGVATVSGQQSTRAGWEFLSVVKKVACTYCPARVGEPCLRANGNVRKGPHQRRVNRLFLMMGKRVIDAYDPGKLIPLPLIGRELRDIAFDYQRDVVRQERVPGWSLRPWAAASAYPA